MDFRVVKGVGGGNAEWGGRVGVFSLEGVDPVGKCIKPVAVVDLSRGPFTGARYIRSCGCSRVRNFTAGVGVSMWSCVEGEGLVRFRH